ncbi:uncharacterized protein A4U43_C03F14890 [Asparagus officinalis]|uniref:endo-polygalacturonase n=1 Tax=Asparagus officinalis TaxID=4686 RepID=A0A5P1FCZ2_ASPOF|nr:polygalacturonase-like [Asparagus officinalis]ONK75247.1 uncharacterized protein A4U43_C03F14890 [Asparagus officinalis]
MELHGLLLLSLLLFSFHSIPCFGNSEEDAGLYNIMEHPKYYGAFDGEENATDRNPDGFITQSVDEVDGIAASEVVNVADYGAKGDGSDATEAFKKAWLKVCSSPSSATLMVPAKKSYYLKPTTFSGPCKSEVTVMIKGMIKAPPHRSAWDGTNRRHWILFNGVSNLQVTGGGIINGNGQIWWKNSCKINKSLPCKNAPTAITFYGSNNLVVENLKVKNSQQIHVQFEKCTNVRASHLSITAPENSPNTDGIHITSTQNINLDHCNIGTGDDCISIVDGAQTVKATNIICGPGHGISIGSLGAKNSEDHVSDVIIDTAKLTSTTNGLRIKTWQGGSGYAKHIRFQNVYMKNVQNPIIIDQNYCDSKEPCHQQKSAVHVSDVVYNNIKGTSASDVAIDFECSKSVPCQGIVLQAINLVKENGGSAKSICKNVNLTKKGTVIPPACA